MDTSTAGFGQKHPLQGPRRLWSLWDMLEKYGAIFATAAIQLSEVKWFGAARQRSNERAVR